MGVNMDIEQSKAIYNALRATAEGVDESKVKAFFSNAKAKGKIKNEQTALETFHLLHKIANQVDEKQWLDFAKTSELPPIKLSPAEMELARGGVAVSVMIGIGTLIIFGLGAGYEAGRREGWF